MVRFSFFPLGTLTAERPGRQEAVRYRTDDPGAWSEPGGWQPNWNSPAEGSGWPGQPAPQAPSWPGQPAPQAPSWQPRADGIASPGGPVWRRPAGSSTGPGGPGRRGGNGGNPGSRRRRLSPPVKWTAVIVAVGLIFRRAIEYAVLIGLSAALHLVGVNIHLPSIRFAWPWQTISAGTTTSTDLGPWVLQKIEGISRPALGQANFSFVFTHKVSKNIGPWPCWYASTFYVVGHASATVDLNPGPAWWTPESGHYRLRVLSQPRTGKPGQVSVVMMLPRPQLPQSVHDITIDNIPSKPIDTQHSWTYPGFGCGVVLRPQFPESALYAQAQQIAFYKSQHAAGVTRPLVQTAEAEAAQTIRDSFIQPTLNALGYTLDRFSIRWAAGPTAASRPGTPRPA